MSIAIKKFYSMLDEELKANTNIPDDQKNAIRSICEKVYMLESTDSNAANINSKIRDEIKLNADRFSDKK